MRACVCAPVCVCESRWEGDEEDGKTGFGHWAQKRSGLLITNEEEPSYGKRSFSVTTPCASPTRVDTEHLAERETLLHRLGSKLNRIVFNSCGNSLSVAQITRDFYATRFFWRTEPFTPKKNPKKEVDYF